MTPTQGNLHPASPAKGSLKGLGLAATGAGAAALATAATACCVPVLAPLLVSLLGVSGSVWAAGLHPYSLLILALASLPLAYGFWSVYRRRALAAGQACPAKRPWLPRLALWSAAALWLFALALNMLQLLARRL